MKRKYQDQDPARPPPQHRVVGQIRRALAEIGEPPSKVDTSLKNLADDLSTTEAQQWPPILEMVKALVLEQPHKLPLISLVFEIVNTQRSAVAQAAVEMTHDEVTAAVRNQDFKRLKAFLRFACVLTVATKDAILDLLKALAGKAVREPQSRESEQLFEVLVISCAYLSYSGTEIPQELTETLSTFCEQHEATSADDLAPFSGENAPYQPNFIIDNYVNAAKVSLESEWDTSFLPDLGKLYPRGEVTPKHRFNAVDFDEEWSFQPSERKVRTLLYIEKPPCVPDPNTLFGVVVRDIAGEIIENMDFNRKEVTRQLITLDLFLNQSLFTTPATQFDQLEELAANGQPTLKVEAIALEAVLEQMFQLPKTLFPPVYCDSILIEACVMAPQAIAPVIGKAVRFLFNNAESLDFEIFWRTVSWFAHHVSNFGFTWKWNEWVKYLALPKTHPKYVFMRELIVKQVQLSYPQRVREVLPTEFVELVPNVPEAPVFPYAGDRLAETLIDELTRDHTSKQVDDVAADIRSRAGQNNLGKEASLRDREIASVLVTCICELGNRSITHASNWISRTKGLLTEYIKDENDIIEKVLDYWKESPWIGLLVLHKFIEGEILKADTLVKYILTHKNYRLTSAGWDTLRLYIDQTKEHLDLLESEEEWEEWWNKGLKTTVNRITSS